MNELEQVALDLTEHGWSTTAALGATWFFGPTLKAIRNNLGRWSDFHSANMLKLNEKVQARTHLTGADESSVHPRVAQVVIEQAPWIQDDIQQEYLAGVLIGSRAPDGGSERAAYFGRILANLTARQIRIHRAFYASVISHGASVNLEDAMDTQTLCAVWLPAIDLEADLMLEPGETLDSAMTDAALALHREQLIMVELVGPQVAPSIVFPQPGEVAMKAFPTPTGALLFAWAMGLTPNSPNDIFGPLPPDTPPSLLVSSARSVVQAASVAPPF